jgi:hypothetical protein
MQKIALVLGVAGNPLADRPWGNAKLNCGRIGLFSRLKGGIQGRFKDW